jgi:two-component system sensor histidine kinase YesM
MNMKIKSNFQKRIVLSYFVLFVMLLISAFGATYFLSEKIIVDQIGVSRVAVLQQVTDNINILIKEISSVSSLYALNPELIDIIQNKTDDPYQNNWESNQVMAITSQYSVYFDNLKFYSVLYSFNGRTFNTWFNQNYSIAPLLSQPWYQDVLKKNGRLVWTSTYQDHDSLNKNSLIFTAARLMKGVYSDKPIGVLFLNIYEDVLYRTYQKAIQPGSQIYISDLNGHIISNSERELVGYMLEEPSKLTPTVGKLISGSETVIIHGKKYMRSYVPIPLVNWMIVEDVPLDSLLSSMNKLLWIMFWVGMICLTLGLLISFIIANNISVPIRKLRSDMKLVEQGNLEIVATVARDDELGELVRGFNRMVRRLKELLEQQRSHEELKRSAEIEFLQAQIKPHFLYNTLNSIRIMITFGKNGEAENMLTTLSRLLRKIFETKDDLIPMFVELDYLRDYLELQAYRYPNRFQVEWDIEEDVGKFLIPRLLLQPLVENAIFHGLEPLKGNGCIRISVKAMDQEGFEISVMDNGIGILADRMALIWEPKGSASGHLGLANIRERIRLYFGAQSEVKVMSDPGHGCTVVIRTPHGLLGKEKNQ